MDERLTRAEARLDRHVACDTLSRSTDPLRKLDAAIVAVAGMLSEFDRTSRPWACRLGEDQHG